MKVVHIVAARPNFIKASPIIHEFKKHGHEKHNHPGTNQHQEIMRCQKSSLKS